MDKVVVGGGCFWCVESVFRHVAGVTSVVSGYAGGRSENPTYNEICSGTTGHAEVVEISFDPEVVSLKELFAIFFATHDPTTLNRQGNDSGTQYRSVIYYKDEQQHQVAAEMIEELNAQRVWPDPVVTELSPLPVFYPAEEYHQDFFRKNPFQPYCLFSIPAKLEKLAKKFPANLRQDAPAKS